MAQHRHKRETPATPVSSRIPRSVLVSAPLAVVATLSAVTMGVLAAEPATSDDHLLAASGSQSISGAAKASASEVSSALARRGEIPDITLDGRTVDVQYKSPLARAQARQDVRETLLWLESTAQMGPEAASVVDQPATARWLGDRLGVPGHLMRDLDTPELLAEAAIAALEGEPDTSDAA